MHDHCGILGCLNYVDKTCDGWHCEGCDEVFCLEHMLADEFHDCNSCSDDEHERRYINTLGGELRRFVDTVDLQALAARASAVNGGAKCVVPADRDAFIDALRYGGRNIHFPITFDDGQCWLFRVRRDNKTAHTDATSRYLLLSEVATYKHLTSIGFPVPKVFDFAVDAEGSHGVGVPYMLVEKVAGDSLDTLAFFEYDVETRTKILRQAAQLHVMLADNPLPAIGALHNPASPVVGPLTPLLPGLYPVLGPFSSSLEYWNARIDQMVEGIVQKKMFTRNSFDAYLAALFFREQVQVMYSGEAAEGGHFYLKHTDDKGDHIILNDNLDIIGVVDWEFAWVLPKGQALGAPTWVSEDIYHLQPELSPREVQYSSILRDMGRDDLATCVERGRPHWFLEQCFRCDWQSDYFRERNAPSLLKALGKDMTWDEWQEHALVAYRDDPILKSLSK